MMLARVADSLYWIGRYVERAEHLCRLSDVMLTATLDRTESATQIARIALAAVGDPDDAAKARDPYEAARALVLDRDDAGLGGELPGPRPRERPPGARPDHHRDLGAAEPASTCG